MLHKCPGFLRVFQSAGNDTDLSGRLDNICKCGGGSFSTRPGGVVSLGKLFGPHGSASRLKIEANDIYRIDW